MAQRVLITGGAGFIGSHLADELLEQGYDVRVLDDLSPQVHGQMQRPDYLSADVELIHGDVRSAEVVERALRGVDSVFHFAAMVGVGQSMCQITDYTSVNDLGTAVLLEALVRRPPNRLVVASSMSIYGEGLYRDSAGNLYDNVCRPMHQMAGGQWEVMNAAGETLEPLPTPETKPARLASVYALGKYVQERMCLIAGEAYHIPTVALRFFNVYGPRQALSNPYTGVLAIFASRLLNNRPPVIFEDGLQRRDFVNVADVARGCRLALEHADAPGNVFNIGSGQSFTILQVAQALAQVVGKPAIDAVVKGEYRVGDIRHCYADISHARSVLGYEPRVSFEDGLHELAQWLSGQVAVDRVEAAHAELAARGLTI